jgi:hypothetical protein
LFSDFNRRRKGTEQDLIEFDGRVGQLTGRLDGIHETAAVRKTNFASDNTAPVAPDILDAIYEANHGFARGYGNDDWTQSVERRLSEIFEREVAAFLVPTGIDATSVMHAAISPLPAALVCPQPRIRIAV